MTTIKPGWNDGPANSKVLAVPGGWLVRFGSGHPTFTPDVNHLWDFSPTTNSAATRTIIEARPVTEPRQVKAKKDSRSKPTGVASKEYFDKLVKSASDFITADTVYNPTWNPAIKRAYYNATLTEELKAGLTILDGNPTEKQVVMVFTEFISAAKFNVITDLHDNAMDMLKLFVSSGKITNPIAKDIIIHFTNKN